MPIAYVQSTNASLGSVSSGSLAFPSAISAKSLIVTSFRSGGEPTVTSVTDNNGNPAYSLAVASTDTSTDKQWIYYVAGALAGATTVSWVMSSVNTLRVTIHEYSGISTSTPLDQISSTQATSTAPDSNLTPTTIVANELLFGGVQSNVGTLAPTAGTGYTLRESIGPGKLATEDQVVSVTGAYRATFVYSTAEQWSCAIATFKGAAAGGTGVISTGGATLNTGPRSPVFARFP